MATLKELMAKQSPDSQQRIAAKAAGHLAPLCCVANVLFGKVPGRIQAIAGIYY